MARSHSILVSGMLGAHFGGNWGHANLCPQMCPRFVVAVNERYRTSWNEKALHLQGFTFVLWTQENVFERAVGGGRSLERTILWVPGS